jgi:hypothetical protein
MGIGNDALPVQPFASVAVMVTDGAPEAVGVPLKSPLEFKLKPGGGVPAVIAKVMGVALLPLAVNVVE